MNHFSIAGLQIALKNGNNIEVIFAQITSTKKRFPWVDMIVLSELATYGPEKKHAEKLPSSVEQQYCQLAKKLNVWLIPGSLYEKEGESIYNTTSVINNKGEIVSRYRKIYPFLPYESGISAGSDIVTFDVPGGRIGVAICYDLWFPEVSRSLVCDGAEVIIYPTLTGTVDRTVELSMSIATAATNQCYVFSVNGTGNLGTGQSIVVGPQGHVIHQAGVGEELMPIEIDFSLVRRTRERGLMGLGQPLKSYRDNKIDFPQLNRKSKYLDKLGALVTPAKPE
jgi:predicted amidohydrolase